MPVETLRQVPDDAKAELSDVIWQYKQRTKVWEDWAAEWHIIRERIIDSFPFNYLIKLFKQRCANTPSIPETVVLSLKDTIEGRKRAKDVYDENEIPDTARHDYPIRELEEIYKLATSSQSVLQLGISDDVKPTTVTNDPGDTSSNLRPDGGSDIRCIIAQLSIAPESSISENNSPELSALPGLLMDEIIKCLDEVEERWNIFFRASRPGNLVSTALGMYSLINYSNLKLLTLCNIVACAADDCIRSLTYDVDLLFDQDEKHEFERLAQCFEEKWARQWSVKRVHGVAEPMNESAYREELLKHEGRQSISNSDHESKSKGKNHRNKKKKRDTKRDRDPSRPLAGASATIEPSLELTEALSHKKLSVAVFVPIPNNVKHKTTSSKLDSFRNVVTIHLWHLAAANLADDGTEGKDPKRPIYTAVRSAAIRHAYARSYWIWVANRLIRDHALRGMSPDASLRRIDCAI
jgi:hypothetical protein